MKLSGQSTLQEELASIESTDGVIDSREKFCLWVVRSRYRIDREDSFEYVFTPAAAIRLADEKPTIDGFFTTFDGPTPVFNIITYIDSDVNAELNPRVVSEVSEKVTLLSRSTSDLFDALTKSNRRTRQITLSSETESESHQKIDWNIIVVTPGKISVKSESLLYEAVNSPFSLEVLDISKLRSFARAITEPGTIDATIEIPKRPGEWIYIPKGKAPVLIVPMSGEELVGWDGIQDRRLFDLNVRFGLGINRVRKSLDEALCANDKSDFLASHNGITVVCDAIAEQGDHFAIRGLSVVNGAQSLIALYENKEQLDSDLHLIVKFVAAGQDKDEAAQIAVRSNTQNPVTTRNLRALDDKQLELKRTLSLSGYDYVLRPDARVISRDKTIRNDDAAQWLCGLYLEEPALAVKRQALFQAGTYEHIFAEDIEARHVVFASKLRAAIEGTRGTYPEAYSKSWSLIALTAMYLSGQLLRASKTGYKILLDPDMRALNQGQLNQELERIASYVCGFLTKRRDDVIRNESGSDNFKVDFKSAKKLNQMKFDIQRYAPTGDFAK